ncbi:MAG: calcium/sodium antiporter [Candidatus Sungiibacteriota bacterium]|uniref:Calcium/sodium antiporter n=1 Tax=Candidatus Sungiibacteriota bacterium TaxID=2750080 RepID=A0A7T5RJJ5_9BACT|nr:MAG: calcium/sodium antiporter [Candidatus Sungbacteria bacterium]
MGLLLWTAVFVFSAAVLIKSAGWFVKGAEDIGLRWGMPPFLIGATIVAAGTSLPELASSLAAVTRGETGLVMANVVGSNITNIFLILGVAAISAGGLRLGSDFSLLELTMLLLGNILLAAISWNGIVGTLAGLFLLGNFIVYIVFKFLRESRFLVGESMRDIRGRAKLAGDMGLPRLSTSRSVVLLSMGIVGLSLGAQYVIESILSLSRLLHIPGTLIAITALAIGTSLPELVVSVSAVLKKKEGIAVGNIIGSNIFNALFIVGLLAPFKDLRVDMLTRKVGLPFLILSAVLIIWPWFKGEITRRSGIVYLLIFLIFLTLLAGSLG